MASSTAPVSSKAVAEQLVSAIHAHRLGDACGAICAASQGTYSDADLALAQAGANACRTIHADVQEVAERLVAKMVDQGLAIPEVLPQRSFPQFHFLTLRIHPGDVADVVDIAAQEGFVVDPAIQDRLGQVVRTNTLLQLTASAPFPMRLTLVWKDTKGLAGRLHHMRPDPADIALVRLPRGLTAGYYLIKPVRLLWEKLSGKPVADGLGLRTGSAGLPTPDPLILPLLHLIDVKPDDVVCDVGCGDGRVLTQAAKHFGCKGIGIECNQELIRSAQNAIETCGLSERIKLVHADALAADVSSATVVFLYLPAKRVPRVLAKVRSQVRSGTRIVVHEQVPLGLGSVADERVPVIGTNAMTVAHIWRL